MFKRLRKQFTVICTGTTGCILIVMTCCYLYVAEKNQVQSNWNDYQNHVDTILYYLQEQQIIRYSWIAQTESSSGSYIYLENNGRPLSYMEMKQNEERTAAVNEAMKRAQEDEQLGWSGEEKDALRVMSHITYGFRCGSEFYYADAAVIPIGADVLKVLIVKPRASEARGFVVQRWVFALLVLMGILLLGVFAWIFTGKVIAPVEESRKKQTDFIAAASHELRSPLAVMMTGVSACRQAPKEQADNFLKSIEYECRRLSRLIDDMLLLANADAKNWTVDKTAVELDTLLMEIYEQYAEEAKKKSCLLQIILPDAPVPRCDCDRFRIEQVLSILMDNALRYTPEGGRITLSLQRTGGYFVLHVTDNGKGITHEEKELIFERFYRGDRSRTEKEHYGLGLCIAKDIIAVHKGNISVRDAEGQGADFVITLPEKA